MLEHIVVPIEWKDDSDGTTTNTLVGYASTFGNVDLGGDVVVRGAFKKSVETIKAGNGIPLLADHMPTTTSVLGTIYDAFENTKGLVIKARLSKAPSAQDTAVKLAEGHLSKLSIGYETMDDSYEDRDGVRVRLLKEVKLWETSVVVFPMNPQADISTVKQVVAFTEALPDDSPRKQALKAMLIQDATEHERLLGQPYLPKYWTTGPALEGMIDTTPASVPDEPPGGAKGAADGESAAAPGDGAAPAPGGADGESAPTPGEGAAHWDKYRSEAMLAGRDTGDVPPAKRAGLEERLRIQLSENERLSAAHE
jgi:HK97 family phage prohead protease